MTRGGKEGRKEGREGGRKEGRKERGNDKKKGRGEGGKKERRKEGKKTSIVIGLGSLGGHFGVTLRSFWGYEGGFELRFGHFQRRK